MDIDTAAVARIRIRLTLRISIVFLNKAAASCQSSFKIMDSPLGLCMCHE